MKKLSSLGLVFVLLFGLVACQEKAETTEQTETNTETVETVEETTETEEEATETEEGKEGSKLDLIKESGKLVMGTSADYPPYEFHAIIDGQDQIVGFDVEFAKKIAEGLGVELEIQDMSFDAVLTGVQNGLIDIGVAGINPKPDRDKTIDFSDIYFVSQYCVLTSADSVSEYTQTSDLNGKAIGVQTGTVQEGLVADHLEPGNVVSLPKVTELIMQLKSGMIDAIVLEVPVANSYMNANPDIAIVEGIDFKEFELEGGSAVAIGEGEKELQEAINEIIKELLESDQIQTWYAEAVELSDSLQVQE